MATRKIEVSGRVDRALADASRYLTQIQSDDGSFDLGFDGGALPDAHFVLTDSVLNLGLEDLAGPVARRLLERQLPEGGWSLAPGLEAHLPASVESYVALRAFGLPPSALPLQRARRYIRSAGGARSVSGPTRITLALLGLRSWSDMTIPPPELVLISPKAPVSIFRVSAVLRLHLLPLLVLRALEPVLAPDLGRALCGELATDRQASPQAHPWRPGFRQEDALAACVDLMSQRLDDDGTLGGLLMATSWAATAAHCLGLDPAHPLVAGTRRGLVGLAHPGAGREKPHIQVCRPTIRSTAVALKAMEAAGINEESRERAAQYLVENRAGPQGDFELLGPQGPAVAWSIKPSSRRFPSLLDSVLVAGGLASRSEHDSLLTGSLRWICRMQRPDGGFALFDRDAASATWLSRLPLGFLCHTLSDPSSPEVTGHVIELAAAHAHRMPSGLVGKACGFLERSQRSDGTWPSPFANGFLAGTSAALRGLCASGRGHGRSARRAAGFLLTAQRSDGGWGESSHSLVADEYVDLGRSAPSQTAVALLGLMASPLPQCRQAVSKGIEHLLWTQEPDGRWAEEDPCAAGLADVLSLRSQVDPLAYPIMALAAYQSEASRA